MDLRHIIHANTGGAYRNIAGDEENFAGLMKDEKIAAPAQPTRSTDEPLKLPLVRSQQGIGLLSA